MTTSQPIPPPPPALRPFSALLVSPDRGLLRQLSRFLELFGYEVRQALDAQQAQAAAEAVGADFLLVDAALAQKPGTQFCRTVRKNSPAGYTYALLMVENPEVSDLTEALEAGFDDFLARPVVFGELLSRLRAGARVIEFERRLACQAGTEPVTGLPDEGAFRRKLAQHIAMANERGKQETLGSLAIIDLDSFSRIGRKFGTIAVDALLRLAATMLHQASASGEVVASLGKDRFAVLFPAATEDQAATWAQKYLSSLAAYEQAFGDEKVQLTASAGVVELARGQSAEKGIELALQVLTLAKASGRNCVQVQAALEQDTRTWTEIAASGELFSTTQARDVMLPCPVVLSLDETVEQAQATLELTRLAAIPVVDGEGKFAGLVTAEQLSSKRSRPAKGRASGSVRMVRQVMKTDLPRFDESALLSELMEFFTGDSRTLAVILRDRRPTGLVFCHSLAALNDRLTREHFTPPLLFGHTSEFLMVPDLAASEAE